MTERPLSQSFPLTSSIDWPDEAIAQQPVGQLPRGHNLVLLARLKTSEPRLASVQRTIEHGWSPSVRDLHIEQELGRLPDATPGEES